MSIATSKLISGVEIRPIGSRRIEKKTCERYGYGFATWKGKEVQVASFEDATGTVVAQKLRFTDPETGKKDFRTLGDSSAIGLWGRTRVRSANRILIITEGELDALAVSQVFGNKYPVVSVPHGAQQAKKYIKKDLKWIQNFEQVVFCFDEDEAGRQAVADCRDLIEPGRLRVARLPLKDPCDMLKAHRGDELYRAIWDAPRWTPDSLLHGDELLKRATERHVAELGSYPYDELTELTGGIRFRELVMLCAGSGVGKSTLCNEIAAHCLKQGEGVAVIALEADPYRTTRGIYTVHANRNLITEHGEGTAELVKAAHAEWGDKLYVFDGFAWSDPDELCALLRYIAKGLDTKVIVLDHVSIVISAMETDDERKAIDSLMTRLRKIVEETGVALFLVSHLKRPQGKGHEDGAMVSLSQLRGSAALAQLSDMVIGLERDQQATEESERHISTVRVLKNRYSGRTGPAGHLSFNIQTGRLQPVDDFSGAEMQ
jgi:twinkle protein